MDPESDGFLNITWGTSPLQCAADHFSVFCSLPKILDAYVGCNRMEPKIIESVMVAVNSVNSCPYCTGLHGELARMAGVDDAKSLMVAKTEAEARTIVNHPAVSFAVTFAKNQGRGRFVNVAFEALVKSEGKGRAGCVRALCWFLHWGSLGGNTVNSFLFGRLCCRPKEDSWLWFEILFFLYYGVLFGIIAVVNCLLQYFPKVPNWFMAMFGCVLWLIAGSWIIPAGIISILFFPCYPEGGKLKGRSDYKVNVDEVVKEYTTFADNPDYTMFFTKLESDEKHVKERMNYSDDLLQFVPEELWKTFSGGGNHFNHDAKLDEKYRLQETQVVVDFGSGLGADCLIAANLVGPKGKVVGFDFTPAMVKNGKLMAEEKGLDNLTFEEQQLDVDMSETTAEHTGTVDRVISNGVINLCENKSQVCKNAFNLLKAEGIFIFSDFLIAPESEGSVDVKIHDAGDEQSAALWIDWVAGCVTVSEMKQYLADAGFVDASFLAWNDCYTSIATRGGVMYAIKPAEYE